MHLAPVTENPRVANSAITPVNMHPEGFDLIGAFLWLKVFRRRGGIPVQTSNIQ